MRFPALLALALGLGISLSASDPAVAQQPKGAVPRSLTIYEQFRELLGEGRFDIAANSLQAFLDANPTEADFLEIERRFGTTAFTGLRSVPKWSDDRQADQKARANVEEAIKRSRAASDKLLRDPARARKLIRNLGATYEERVFAELELKRMGDFAVPLMIDELRLTSDKEIASGILGAIPKLEPQTVAGFLAGLDGLTGPQQYGVMTAIVSRPDILSLQSAAQTDITPILWRAMAQPADANPTVRAGAERLLNILLKGSGAKAEGRQPVAELVAIARQFYEHKARYSAVRRNPDGSDTVPVWVWDASTPDAPKLVKHEEVPLRQADEYYALRYARWALEAKPDYEPAQALIVAAAAERAIERAKFGSLAAAEPAVYKLLSDARSGVLNDLLTRGLNQNRTPLVLAMVQVLGDRADRDAATPPAGSPPRPAPLVRALNYPDPQVQLAAADALLRSPVPVPPEVRGRVIEILRRAAAADVSASGAKGTALLADPNRQRGDALAALFRGAGYNAEVFRTGRDLLRRIARASDFELIVIDHHAADPVLIDLVGQLRADANTAKRPTFVIASPDKPRLPTFDQLLVRFAALIASTDNEVVNMPPPYTADPRDTPDQMKEIRATRAEARDGVFRTTAATRIDRLRRLVESTGIQLSPAQKLLLDLRIELITYAALGVEYTISPESSPATVRRIEQVRNQIALQPLGLPYGTGTPTTDLLILMERFEIDLARVPAAQKRFENLYAALNPVELGLPVETFRDPVLEARLERTLREYPAVRVIPEPYTRSALEADLAAAQAQPGQGVRDPAIKKADQRTALSWLARMATGEVRGFDVKSAESELRAALRSAELGPDVVDGVASFPSAEAQQALLAVALSVPPEAYPPALRIRAADAAVRHIQANGKLIARPQLDQLARTGPESDANLNGKLMALKGLLLETQAEFAKELQGYNPPLVPPLPKLPPMDPKDPKDPKLPDNKK